MKTKIAYKDGMTDARAAIAKATGG